MDVPSRRVTQGRVLVLGVVTFVALAYGTLRWSASEEPPGATRGSVATGRDNGGSAAPGAGAGPATTTPDAAEQLLTCLRSNESRNEYTAVSPSGRFFGAYQFDQQTWDNTAVHAGLPGLVRVQPNLATPAEQDQMALALLQWQGTSPWDGDPCVS